MKLLFKTILIMSAITSLNIYSMGYLLGDSIKTQVEECVKDLLSPKKIKLVLPSKSLQVMLNDADLINVLVDKAEKAAKNHPLILNNARALLINSNYNVAKENNDTKRMTILEQKVRELLGKQTNYKYEDLIEIDVKKIAKDEREKLTSVFVGIPDILKNKNRKSMRELFYKISDAELDFNNDENCEFNDDKTDNDDEDSN